LRRGERLTSPPRSDRDSMGRSCLQIAIYLPIGRDPFHVH
jgi:hypothetical protein